MIKKLSLAVLSLFALASLGFGQTAITSTTLSSAVGRGDTIVTLASSTGVSAAGLSPVTGGYIDREYVTFASNVNAAGTGNVWNVKRNQGGIQSAHASGATVWIGVPGQFDQGPNDRVGACTSTNFAILPFVEVRSGTLITCGSNGAYAQFGSASDASVGTVIASATTVAPTNAVTHISGTTAIVNITVPAALPDGGTFTFIPDGAFTYTAAGNIVSTGTGVVGKAMIFTYDKTAAKLYPSY